MSTVLSDTYTPTTTTFGGSSGTPLYIDRTGKRAYYLDSSGNVVDLLTGVGAGVGLYEDLRFPFGQTRRSATEKPDFDYTNLGLLFPQNDATEIIYMLGQFPHSYVEGTDIKPHIHWQQTSGVLLPTWKLAYKWFNRGETVPGAFTTVTATSHEYTYTSGNMHQMSRFADIVGSGKTVSSMILMKFWREDNVALGDVLAWEFDIHYQANKFGTVGG